MSDPRMTAAEVSSLTFTTLPFISSYITRRPQTNSNPPPFSPELPAHTAAKLNMMRSHLRLHIIEEVGKPIPSVYVGAIIFRGPKLIILRKDLESQVDYDLPCRKFVSADLTLAHVVAAVVKEQTGLVVKTILRELSPPIRFSNSFLVKDVMVTAHCIQLNFFVEVEDGEVVIEESGVELVEIEDGMIEARHEVSADIPEGCKSLMQYIFANKLIEEGLGNEDSNERKKDEVSGCTSNGLLDEVTGKLTLDDSFDEERHVLRGDIPDVCKASELVMGHY